MTHEVFESAGARTPVAGWEVAVTEGFDVAGVVWLVFGEDVLLVGHLSLRGDGSGDAAGDEQEVG